MQSRILILGGGITGLSAAAYLKKFNSQANALQLNVTLWESRDRLGGVLQTEITSDGFLIEQSADNFLCNESWVTDLAELVGIRDELIPTRAYDRRASILSRGKIHNVPDGFVLMSPSAIWPMLATPLLSWSAKLRMAREWFIAPRPADQADESLASFVRRRFGDEVFERLIQPLIGGIYTADPEKLSLAATLPRFLDMEREHGSLLRATLKGFKLEGPIKKLNDSKTEPVSATLAISEVPQQSGARYNQFMAPRLGMSQFVDAIEKYLADFAKVRLNTRASRIEFDADQRVWKVWNNESNESGQPTEFERVIITSPAPVSANLLKNVSNELSQELAAIEYAGCNVVIAAFDKSQFPRLPGGFGLVVPAIENRKIIAVSYTSEKFVGRAPDGKIILRVFVGGALQPELVRLSDDDLQKIVNDELKSIYKINGEPLWIRVAHWNGAMPQYHLGHLERIARIDALTAQFPGLALAGAALRGVGIPQCIKDGKQAAERVKQSAH